MIRPSWLDWRRRNVRDAIVITGSLIAAFTLLDLGEEFKTLAHLAEEYEAWGADDAFFLSFFLSFALLIYSVRRLQDLTKEVKARRLAEEEAHTNRVAIEQLREENIESEVRRSARKKRTLNAIADGFEKAVGSVVKTVSSTSTQLQDAAAALARAAEATQQLSTQVATAAQGASSNVHSVAVATDALSSSVAQISQQVRESRRISGDAVGQAVRTDARILELSKAMNQIGDVTKLITDIAGQTHLLALNATIEAARAGEAGRGFAVVAQEVKALSAKTAAATTEISALVGGIQAATLDSVAAIKGIGATIGGISEIASSIAAAVEEQGTATQEIARSVQYAADGTSRVAINIGLVDRGTAETMAASAQVLSSAKSLSHESDNLRAEAEQFLTAVRDGFRTAIRAA
jgi:methyl-accepting chemotaxis protein